MTEKKKLTPQERGEMFQEAYVKLCEEWKCQHVPFPTSRQEGKIIIVEAGLQVMVNDD